MFDDVLADDTFKIPTRLDLQPNPCGTAHLFL